MTAQIKVRVGRNTRTSIKCIREGHHQVFSHFSGVGVQPQTLAEGIDEAIVETSRVATANVVHFSIDRNSSDPNPMPRDLTHMWDCTTHARLRVQELLWVRLPRELASTPVVVRATWICIRPMAQMSAIFTATTARPNRRTNV